MMLYYYLIQITLHCFEHLHFLLLVSSEHLITLRNLICVDFAKIVSSKVLSFTSFLNRFSRLPLVHVNCGFYERTTESHSVEALYCYGETLKKKLDSLGSPVACVRLRPKSAINSRPLSLIGPSVSMATGTKM